MIDKAFAEKVNVLALDAIAKLNDIVNLQTAQSYTDKEYLEIRKAIGLVIGSIDIDILCKIYKYYPDLDVIDKDFNYNQIV